MIKTGSQKNLSPELIDKQKEKGTYDSPCMSICDYEGESLQCATCSMRKEEKIRWKSGDKQIKESLLTTITKRQSQDPDQLAEKNCIPCQGKVAPLSNEACQVLLKKINEGWSLDEAGTRLSNSYKFSDYKSAWDLVNSISELSEEQWHHPQITFGWGFLEIQIWTHQIDALVESDFVLAAKIDLLQAST